MAALRAQAVVIGGALAAGLLTGAARVDVPVDPDAPTARDWFARELAKNEYQEAKPTLLDQLSKQFFDWLSNLSAPTAPGGPPVGFVGLILIGAIIAVVAFLIWGAPRLRRRSRVAGSTSLFGEDDTRTAAELRAAAERAARGGDWALAIAEQFRAIARGLGARTIVTLLPGSTSGAVAARAAQVFPALAPRLHAGAAAFDGVRYLGAAGDEAGYRELHTLDRELQAARPQLDAAPLPELLPR